jgi:hypothetical protein
MNRLIFTERFAITSIRVISMINIRIVSIFSVESQRHF